MLLDDLPEVDDFSSEGENRKAEDADVVYGTGSITWEAVVSFVTTYPESALKYLLQKDSENKALKPEDDKIYTVLHKRGMQR